MELFYKNDNTQNAIGYLIPDPVASFLKQYPNLLSPSDSVRTNEKTSLFNCKKNDL